MAGKLYLQDLAANTLAYLESRIAVEKRRSPKYGLGLTERKVAEAMGISPETFRHVYRVRPSGRVPSIVQTDLLMRALGISVYDLLLRKDKEVLDSKFKEFISKPIQQAHVRLDQLVLDMTTGKLDYEEVIETVSTIRSCLDSMGYVSGLEPYVPDKPVVKVLAGWERDAKTRTKLARQAAYRRKFERLRSAKPVKDKDRPKTRKEKVNRAIRLFGYFSTGEAYIHPDPERKKRRKRGEIPIDREVTQS